MTIFCESRSIFTLLTGFYLDKALRAYLNFTRVRFESSFRGYFSVFTRMILSYLTRENEKKDRKKTQK